MKPQQEFLSLLSKRERAVALAVTHPPRTTEEAARYLDREPNTVTNHLTSVYRKMQAVTGEVDVKDRRPTLRSILGGEG